MTLGMNSQLPSSHRGNFSFLQCLSHQNLHRFTYPAWAVDSHVTNKILHEVTRNTIQSDGYENVLFRRVNIIALKINVNFPLLNRDGHSHRIRDSVELGGPAFS
jgi:hypothetical protein